MKEKLLHREGKTGKEPGAICRHGEGSGQVSGARMAPHRITANLY